MRRAPRSVAENGKSGDGERPTKRRIFQGRWFAGQPPVVVGCDIIVGTVTSVAGGPQSDDRHAAEAPVAPAAFRPDRSDGASGNAPGGGATWLSRARRRNRWR